MYLDQTLTKDHNRHLFEISRGRLVLLFNMRGISQAGTRRNGISHPHC